MNNSKTHTVRVSDNNFLNGFRFALVDGDLCAFEPAMRATRVLVKSPSFSVEFPSSDLHRLYRLFSIRHITATELELQTDDDSIRLPVSMRHRSYIHPLSLDKHDSVVITLTVNELLRWFHCTWSGDAAGLGTTEPTYEPLSLDIEAVGYRAVAWHRPEADEFRQVDGVNYSKYSGLF